MSGEKQQLGLIIEYIAMHWRVTMGLISVCLTERWIAAPRLMSPYQTGRPANYLISRSTTRSAAIITAKLNVRFQRLKNSFRKPLKQKAEMKT